jgi:hypothetical protein
VRTLLFVLSLLPLAAHAARPFVTDDARVVEKGGCQVETFFKDQQRYNESEFWFLPACNPWGSELTLGHIRFDSTPTGDLRTTVLQAKTLLKPLTANGSGFALTLGMLANTANSPYFNAIGSFSLANDRVVLHANLGGIRDNVAHLSRGTWGIGAEIQIAPRWYGILESYGQRGEQPTLHGGLRIWLVPDRLQVDTTLGWQDASPQRRRFGTVGLRILW